jgi:Fur family zinc uptake transcriptional regulator
MGCCGLQLLHIAEAHCEKTGGRLTPPRRQVLEILGASEQPLGAYDIISQMPKGTKPPTVYRALEFWEEEGFVHRIGSLGLYAACKSGHRHDGAMFLICQKCGTVAEFHMHGQPVNEADMGGFTPDSWALEVKGICANCQPA